MTKQDLIIGQKYIQEGIWTFILEFAGFDDNQNCMFFPVSEDARKMFVPIPISNPEFEGCIGLSLYNVINLFEPCTE